ncbi:hypothetical protein P691DRAFT_806437 [Macrolepiota fuliginosa MF-IS2]|uniref:NACHT domain-containing protein n=1 Tax=Macrolepiota fuliginosa MF-IS2 TaxID=1400762 RepID=A0A9P5X5L0_9AGAR|nr:hypothetical protein P691DRAFT_806437 [Macrolepiota fuliginosa MF-IS2]
MQGHPVYPQQHSLPYVPGPPGASFFPGAHHMNFQNPNFVEKYTNNVYSYNYSYPHTGSSVIDLLSQRSMPNAELDSFERSRNLPSCLEGTREGLLSEIKTWMVDQNHKRDALWLYGPAGVGKSALAQTLGEWARESGVLGAAVFLSGSESRNDLSRLVISIAYQLAKRDAQYGVRVAEKLVADVGLLTKKLGTQFRKLIDEPSSGFVPLEKKLVIIIDGLDESLGDEEQCQVLQLIGGALASSQPLPFRWMICSRPEPHLRHSIWEFGTRCKWMVVPMDDGDIDVFIRDGFRRIVNSHPHAIGPEETWPDKEDKDTVVHASSGLFVYASTIIKFIEDRNIAMPREQLKIVLAFIKTPRYKSGSSRTNPLKPLDELYLHILSRVHEDLLLTTLQLLGTCALLPQLPVLELANLLNISRERFYAALQRLHSVVYVPAPDKASMDHLRFFHSSFVEFLRSSSASTRHCFNPRDIHCNFVEACLRALGKTKLLYAKELPWKSLHPNPLSIADQILTYAATHVWSACTSIEDLGGHPLLDMILDFNFTRLQFVGSKIPARQLRYFVRWLAAQMKKNHRSSIIRWNEVQEPLFASREVQDKDRCFVIGKQLKAIAVYITSDTVILSRE